MARSNRVNTLLPLDRYAEIMGINPCAFNQVHHPDEPYPSDCNDVWLQEGYVGGADRIVGRENVAQAIDTAEKQIGSFLGFPPAPTWVRDERQSWPYPKRGVQDRYPPIELNWGWVLSGGVRGLTAIEEDAAIVYSDADGDTVSDTATIVIDPATWDAADASVDEVAVYYVDEDDDKQRIRNLDIEEDTAGNLVITGPRCYFVDPDYWLDDEQIDLSDDTYFLTTVDVYRRYNDTSTQAELVYQGTPARSCATSLCEETCQDACITVENQRLGIVLAAPASYSSTDDEWTLSCFTSNMAPNQVRFWYQTGLPLQADGRIRSDLTEAIVRLANTHLPKAPCGCDLTRLRYERDWEEIEMNSLNAVMADSHFGTTRRGGVSAMAICRGLKPIGSAGSI